MTDSSGSLDTTILDDSSLLVPCEGSTRGQDQSPGSCIDFLHLES